MFRPIDAFLGLFSKDLGIDLGTANTLVYIRNKGVVISEPSVVAISKKSKVVLAVGAEAKKMVGRTPSDIVAIRPLKDGVIADFETVEKMLEYFIQKVHNSGLVPRPRVVVGIPSGVTEVEKRAVKQAAQNAGAREAHLVEEPMAAAIGANLPVSDACGSMIVDIGGGTTEVAVISLGGMVISHSIRVAGDEIDDMIMQFARHEYNLLIGERTAEETKISIGSAYPLEEEREIIIRGRDLVNGLPKEVAVTSEQIREAIAGPVNQVVNVVKQSIEETPPEFVADIMDCGIYLAGGGALLLGLAQRLRTRPRCPSTWPTIRSPASSAARASARGPSVPGQRLWHCPSSRIRAKARARARGRNRAGDWSLVVRRRSTTTGRNYSVRQRAGAPPCRSERHVRA